MQFLLSFMFIILMFLIEMESRCDDGADDDADKSDLQLVREERMPVFSQHGTHVDQKYGPGDRADDGQDREFR